jgi:hypothetical protein
MSKRRLVWLIAVPVLLGFVVWLEPTRVPWGLMSGEAFYDGRPTSYWRQELQRWRFVFEENWRRQPAECWWRERSQFDMWLDRFREDKGVQFLDRPRILAGDPHAEQVLNELQNDRSERVRENAALGMKAIRQHLRIHGTERVRESLLLPQ